MAKPKAGLDPNEAGNAAQRLDELLRLLKGSDIDFAELAAILEIAVKFGCATSSEASAKKIAFDPIRLKEILDCLLLKSREHLKKGGRRGI